MKIFLRTFILTLFFVTLPLTVSAATTNSSAKDPVSRIINEHQPAEDVKTEVSSYADQVPPQLPVESGPDGFKLPADTRTLETSSNRTSSSHDASTEDAHEQKESSSAVLPAAGENPLPLNAAYIMIVTGLVLLFMPHRRNRRQSSVR
ncbi:hypothetical protein [Macrococcus equipercicus]|uniref:LPXTG cell wall anchor domain-containing protein n=1 Tax=Macrococcus equipercicus TaxID=69967 RepID=A0A9Q9F0Y3_9STAP|nr:hypothetical protein [Macrococcus equipercicus]UTH13453.1 hypothetical protein KFV11_09500 [Macrococcus equipercicus]